MAVQDLPNETTDNVRRFDVASGFSIRAVDGRRRGQLQPDHPGAQKPLPQQPVPKPVPVPKITVHPNDDPALGPALGKFVGTFEGTGMNMIFRPKNKFTSALEDNLLEINLTVEKLQFMESSILGLVPNRGFDNQEDVNLTGIPYQQTISDELNELTGKPDLAEKIAIHFEQGLFMRTPATVSPDTSKRATISRMGSIPHGTTINLQDFEPQAVIKGRPNIPDIKIVPFTVGASQDTGAVPLSLFKNMSVLGDVGSNVRKPKDLTAFDKNKTITLASLNNPNKLLKDINANKDIANHWTFTVQDAHSSLGGGGLANISFLKDGNKPTISGSVRGNANAVRVTCTYWISTVRHKVVIPKGDYTRDDPILAPKDHKDGVPGPRFKIGLKRKTTQDNTIEVTSTQIQYSQNVTLDFGILSWPHISVATLVPVLPVGVPAGSAALASVK